MASAVMDPYEQQFIALLVASGLAMYRTRLKEAGRTVGVTEGPTVRAMPQRLGLNHPASGVSHPALINHVDA